MRDLVDELLQRQVKAKLFGEQPPVMVERWQLVDRIGGGAMGTVFAAYDAKLDRKVAIKVLRVASDRVLDEARALAKLSHPNVVAVFDAGASDGVVYIVMELAPGSSLRSWAPGKDWREIAARLRDVASGIAAAHEAGLVHRDIKPDNILVGDDRARLVDFGLAHSGDDSRSAGTPSYMAPEVAAGHTATAASDQYSFGVTLYEALHGVRPGTTSAAQVPPWLDAIAQRMLATEPGDRYASMRDVVHALRRDRRRVRIAAVVVAAVAGIGLGAIAMHRHGGDACNDGPAHRGAVWNEAVRGGVAEGLAGAPWAARTLAAFDDAATGWEASYRTVCEATRKHGNQSDALLELRMHCLDRRLDRLGALAAALGNNKDNAARLAAPSAVASLPPASECETLSDAAELALPTDPAERDKARGVEHELDRGWAAFSLGRYKDAHAIAQNNVAASAKLDAPGVRASALVLAAAVDARTGTPAEAHAQLAAALDAASAAHAGALELDVWARMLRTELFAGDPSKVIEWAPFARAAAARANRKGAEIDGIVAEAERDAGNLGAAKQLLDHALVTPDGLRPDQIAVLELNVASIELATGDSIAAHTTLTRARDRVIGVFGDRHPELALYDEKLAAAARARGKLRAAFALHDRSAELRIAAFGADDRAVSTSLFHRAETELEAGNIAKAEHALHQAIAIRTKVYGDTNARLGELYAALGDCILARGDVADAREQYGKAIQLDPRLLPLALARGMSDAAITPLGADEVLSIDRAAALVVAQQRVRDAKPIADSLLARYRPGTDPALVISIARAVFAAGDHARAAELFTAALASTGSEPNRTALDATIGLARCETPQAGQAARTAISLFQAMPELGRDAMPLMQQLGAR